MACNPRRALPHHLSLTLVLCGLVGAAAACSSGGSGSTTGAGGSGGSSAGTGGGAGSGGATGSGGSPATGGTTGSGGSATGGSGGGTGGAATDGGSKDGGGEAGGGTDCAGNAISLSANGTGTASDAAHARVMVDLMNDLPLANANRTLEFWAYVKTTDWVGETNTIFEYGTQGATAAGFGLDFGTNAVTNMAGNHATLDPYTNGGFDGDSRNYLGITSTMDQWVHFAMTWDGTSVKTYVNGALGITTTGTGGATMLATARTQLTIGCNNPRFSCFNGLIDEFRVWNVARSATDIMNNYNKGLVGNEAGLVGYWKFNETSGTTVADSVTSTGHTAHPGMLMAVMANQTPTFVAPPVPLPITCP